MEWTHTKQFDQNLKGCLITIRDLVQSIKFNMLGTDISDRST